MDKIEELFIRCECNSSEHQFTIAYSNDKDDEFYLTTHLTTYHHFFKRVWIGIKYAFGYKCRYGNFDTVIISRIESKRIIEYLTQTNRTITSTN